MTTRRLVQNFRHLRGIVWGGPATAADTLQTTLARLGMSLVRAQDADLIALDCNRDVIFADGDCDLDPALIRRPGTTLPPAPTIGLVGVEAPSRLKMLDELGATAFLRKPVHAAAIYSSLFLAVNGYHRLSPAGIGTGRAGPPPPRPALRDQGRGPPRADRRTERRRSLCEAAARKHARADEPRRILRELDGAPGSNHNPGDE